MKLDNALYLALSMDPNYKTGRKLTVHGRDAYGNPVTEEIDELDNNRIRRDIDALKLRGGMDT